MSFLYSQLFVTPPVPTRSFANETVIVTGANVGLGLEAARHITQLGASKVILAVRNVTAGDEAKTSIEKSTGRKGVVEVWELDLASYKSVVAFGEKAKSTLSRLDCLLENAGLATDKFSKAEDNERTITVNVISTFLLAFLLLPLLRDTAKKFNTTPRLTIVSSEVHGWTSFAEKQYPNILEALGDQSKSVMKERYQTSKLCEVLVIRELLRNKDSPFRDDSVVLSMLNPGLCHSALSRDSGYFLVVLKFFLARTTEVGSRTLVAAASNTDKSAHGKYQSDAKVSESSLSPFATSEEGTETGERLWKELKAVLEGIKPGVTSLA